MLGWLRGPEATEVNGTLVEDMLSVRGMPAPGKAALQVRILPNCGLSITSGSSNLDRLRRGVPSTPHCRSSSSSDSTVILVGRVPLERVRPVEERGILSFVLSDV